MLRQINSITRRKFLKGTAYASALSASGLSGLASAAPVSVAQDSVVGTKVAGDAGVIAVTLANRSDNAVALNALQPVSIDSVNGWAVIKINKAKSGADALVAGKQISLAAGQQCTFVVDADLAPALPAEAAYITITNEYSSVDNMVPVMPVDTMVA